MLPPSPVRTIGDALNEKKISWAYFGGSYNDAVALSNDAAGTSETSLAGIRGTPSYMAPEQTAASRAQGRATT